MTRTAQTASKNGRARQTKKARIVALFLAGEKDLESISERIGCRPSYVASVLQSEKLLSGYFDLYTHSSEQMNVYSDVFANRLGFRTPAVALESAHRLEEAYRKFEQNNERAGQHHTLLLALTLMNRARWIGKVPEAAIFRDWLISKFDFDLFAEHAQRNSESIDPN